jgi:rhamnulokinase
MSASPAYVAFDLGAESGRVFLGRLETDHILLKEIHRFPNRPVQIGDSLYWDVLFLWEEMKHGLALAAREARDSLVSLGVDTWGVDFGLLDTHDQLIGNPFHYRDRRTEGILEKVSHTLSPDEIYRQTGIQLMPINSLYQLAAMAWENSPQLAAAERFLNMPDLFNFWFSGVKSSEYTIATTTQCYCPSSGNWAWDLLKRLEIPAYIFSNIVAAGTVLGKIRRNILEDGYLLPVNVIAVASHDTQAAITAIPAETENYIYLSSGTWSLIGTEIDHPLLNEAGQKSGLSNEGGYGGRFCLLKNITGLWLLQECRREWSRVGQEYTYDDLTRLATSAPSLKSFINPNDPVFLSFMTMTDRIQAYCHSTGQPVPEQPSEFVRCILESLALEYRLSIEQIVEVTGRTFPVIHVVGGGAQNELLNQCTANATGMRLIAGPTEATALGNILVQAMAVGHVASLAEGRRLVRRSVETHEFEPVDTALWEFAYDRYVKLRSRK